MLGRQHAVRTARFAAPACLAAVLLADLTGWMAAGPAPLRILGLELPAGRFEAEAAIAAVLLVGALVLPGGLRTRSGPALAAAGLTAAAGRSGLPSSRSRSSPSRPRRRSPSSGPAGSSGIGSSSWRVARGNRA
ncbi:MAG TPA: hypothetical protein VGF31_13265, partial [Myxococcaceae bacterium]